MAKTRTDLWKPDQTPSLLIIHVEPEDSNVNFPFHAIVRCDLKWWSAANPIIWVPPPPDDWIDYPDPTSEQLLMTRALLADPDLISPMCYYCNGRFNHPFHVVWNIHRGGTYPYGVAACPWNGVYPSFEWTPDYWPPWWYLDV